LVVLVQRLLVLLVEWLWWLKQKLVPARVREHPSVVRLRPCVVVLKGEKKKSSTKE